jgi:hypothetical protein
MKKEAKIAGLAWRFGDENMPHGGIKLPFSKERVAPWSMLFDQIKNFNPMGHNGGLTHDDVLDAVSMSQLLIPGLPKKPMLQRDLTRVPVVDKIIEHGQTHDKSTGEPLSIQLDFFNTSPKVLEQIIEVMNNARPDQKTDSRI